MATYCVGGLHRSVIKSYVNKSNSSNGSPPTVTGLSFLALILVTFDLPPLIFNLFLLMLLLVG